MAYDGVWGGAPAGSGAEPQAGSGAAAPAGCGAEPREENFDDFCLKIGRSGGRGGDKIRDKSHENTTAARDRFESRHRGGAGVRVCGTAEPRDGGSAEPHRAVEALVAAAAAAAAATAAVLPLLPAAAAALPPPLLSAVAAAASSRCLAVAGRGPGETWRPARRGEWRRCGSSGLMAGELTCVARPSRACRSRRMPAAGS